MASVFTFDPDPSRVSSPWSTPGTTTPLRKSGKASVNEESDTGNLSFSPSDPGFLEACGITKLDPEPQDGPTEYKLHLLLRPRRSFLSLTSGKLISGSHHSKPPSSVADSAPESPDPSSRPVLTGSTVPRQNRLHQLTTQLLWRLQQSSPFHSSSTANLVLPTLPEATTALHVPKELSTLLPGLEESQGALYEIGVSDDGTFVGLAEDELDESLINLRAMAASLGCQVEVLRRVAVGWCKWEDQKMTTDGGPLVRSEKLWVAEALVSPDRKQSIGGLLGHEHDIQREGELVGAITNANFGNRFRGAEQLHVAIAGATGAGKSSLLGILSTSAFDNGRGKSRLSLLRHRHEIASGVTSSVAQELIGYNVYEDGVPSDTTDVINFATGNVTSWDDIHVAAGPNGRVVFLTDLPGSLRYIKSTLRGLISLKPQYVLLCVPANGPEVASTDEPSEVDISLAFLDLCVKLEISVVVVVTKLDLATRSGIRQTLTQVLSAIKSTGRKPVMLPVPGEKIIDQDPDLQNILSTDQRDAKLAVDSMGLTGIDAIPIALTSSVTGAGIGKLHALLRSLRLPQYEPQLHIQTMGAVTGAMQLVPRALFDINEVFEMPLFKVYSLSNDSKRENDRGVVLCGRVRRGMVTVGDRLVVGPILHDSRVGNDRRGSSPARSKSITGKSLPDTCPSTLIRNIHAEGFEARYRAQDIWKEVRVVSVRNLRLPVKGLFEDQIGTIGIDLVDPASSCLGRFRKGMILADFNQSQSASASSSLLLARPISAPFFHTGFVARFLASDFVLASTSLVTGGHAMVYIDSIRAATKIIKVSPVNNGSHEDNSALPTEPDTDIFTLDPAADLDNDSASRTEIGQPSSADDLMITFALVSTVEWIEIGSRVLAIPGAGVSTTISTSSSSPSTSSLAPQVRGSASSSGLNGVVGRICDVLHT
ncbi:hypothetical protein FQN57_002672 [Myotisia sp. PD_48]|nr:hypothetical protein FQN57_002672 [Myotisia sp. PD_48]